MICTIYSKVKTTEKIWKKIVNAQRENNSNTYDIDPLINDMSQLSVDNMNKGYGILMNYIGYKCIITCSHIIGIDNMRIDAYINDKSGKLCKESCNVLLNLHEYDIAILEFVNADQSDNYEYFTKDQCNTKINKINKNDLHFIKYGFVENILNLQIINYFLNVNNVSIENNYVRSTLTPKIPLIKVDSVSNDVDLKGLSGAPLLSNIDNKCLGIVSNFYKNIYCIPMALIFEFLEKFIISAKCELCGIFINTDIVESETSDSNALTCHQITNAFELSYASTGKKNFKFKCDDVITKINNKGFNDDGTVYYDKLDCDLLIDTYCMLETLNNTSISVNLFRPFNENYKEITTQIFGKKLNSVYNIHSYNTNNYCCKKNYVFMELSDELASELINNRFMTKDILEYKTLKNNNNKLVIAIHNNTAQIIDKIGTKKINSLKDINKLFSDKSINILTIKNATSSKIMI